MTKVNVQNNFELLSTNRSLRQINDSLLDENSRLTKKNKDLIEIVSLQKDVIGRLELSLMDLLGSK
jgi:hypothetical protein